MKNWIEVTTKIGCKNMCKYCPQDVFVSAYKQNNVGDSILSLDNFKILLQHVDNKITDVHFSGFSESMLNDESIYMMIHAYNMGYNVVLYTTLVGFDENKCNILKDSNIIFESVTFHEFDGHGFNQSSFYKKIDLFVGNIKLNSQYQVQKITNPWSRGSNLYEVQYKKGAIKCSQNRFYNNVLLPNGDVYLCCSDWGMKQKIGNLYDHHYNSEEFENMRSYYMELCLLDDSDVLCRSCELSYNI